MLNLLFISNNHKVQYIKSVLQPVLKVIIDVVPDFDHGLKDVFEKRPNTVCIQEHISGVTGESVARHIQMLLGSGAPKFILMHEGNPKVKTINGLFEHVVDLNQPDDVLAENFQSTLKTLLGDQWAKVAVAPELPSLGSFLDSEEALTDADKMIDDFLSDLENSSFSEVKTAADSAPSAFGGNLLSSSDEIAELLVSQSNLAKNNEMFSSHEDSVCTESPADATSPVNSSSLPLPEVTVTPPRSFDQKQSSEIRSEKSTVATHKTEPANPPEPVLSPLGLAAKDTKNKSNPVFPATASKPVTVRTDDGEPDSKLGNIAGPEKSEEKIPNDLLRAFEKNYRSEKSHTVRKVAIGSLLVVSVVVAAWFLLKSDSQYLSFFKQNKIAENPKQSVPAVKPLETVAKRSSFIPVGGQDKSYSARNPGWERYAGGRYEIRIYKKAGQIKAVQVLSTKGNNITEEYLNTVFKEISGTSEIMVTSKKDNSGLTELRGETVTNSDFVIYKKGNLIRAFVLSLK